MIFRTLRRKATAPHCKNHKATVADCFLQKTDFRPDYLKICWRTKSLNQKDLQRQQITLWCEESQEKMRSWAVPQSHSVAFGTTANHAGNHESLISPRSCPSPHQYCHYLIFCGICCDCAAWVIVNFFRFQSFLASVLWGLCSTLSRSDGLRSFASLGVTRYWLALLRFSRSSPRITVQGRQPVVLFGPFHKPFHCDNISFIKRRCINWVQHSLCILMLFCGCSPLVKQFIVHHGCFDLGLWEM